MKKNGFILIIIIIGLFFLINTASVKAGESSCSPIINLINQDPNPAQPGDYVKVIFEVSGLENPNCKGMSVKLNSAYPFSLDYGNNGIRTLQGSTYTSGFNSNWNLPYKIRIADDALEGDYQLRLLYHLGIDEDFSSGYTSKDFNITLTDSQTSFDTVIQGVSGTQTSIGIVNTGKNTANSLVIGIPQQNSFVVTGTNQQIVGNLAVGDYTIVSFNLLPKILRNSTRMGNESQPSANFNSAPSNLEDQTLEVKIDYTDGIGKRRSVVQEVPISRSLFSGNITGRTGLGQTNSSASTFNWWYVAGGAIILIIAYISYNKYKKRLNAQDIDKENSSAEKLSKK